MSIPIRHFFHGLILAAAIPCSGGLATITSQPQSQTNAVGDFVSFDVVATSTEPLGYKWRKNGSADNIPNDSHVTGKTDSSLQLYPVSATDGGTYTVVVSNSSGTITSSNAIFKVLVPPILTTQPISQQKIQGSNVMLTVRLSTINAPTPPLSFQWFHDGELLVDTNGVSGATSTNLTLTDLQDPDSGDYWVVVSNPATQMTGDDVYSTNATLSVLIVPTINSFDVLPDDGLVGVGDFAIFTVDADGQPDLTYTWRLNGNMIDGETDAVLAVYDAVHSDEGFYTVDVRSSTIDAYSAQLIVRARSDPIYLRVLDPPLVTSGPTSVVTRVGTTLNAAFSVVATGTAPLKYQWLFNDVTIPGATGSSYSKSILQWDDAGSYSVVITNDLDTITSDDAVLSLTSPPPARINWIARTTDKKYRMQINGNAVGHFEIQQSSPLAISWSPLTNLLTTNSVFEFIDADTNRTMRFYRVQSLP